VNSRDLWLRRQVRSFAGTADPPGLRGLAALYVVLFHYFPLAATSNFSNPYKPILAFRFASGSAGRRFPANGWIAALIFVGVGVAEHTKK
jgi:peptidoglycan/LPS O-acetylase OafA/YrhL